MQLLLTGNEVGRWPCPHEVHWIVQSEDMFCAPTTISIKRTGMAVLPGSWISKPVYIPWLCRCSSIVSSRILWSGGTIGNRTKCVLHWLFSVSGWVITGREQDRTGTDINWCFGDGWHFIQNVLRNCGQTTTRGKYENIAVFNTHPTPD